MQIGVVGLGRMGGNMSRRLMKAGHHCVVFDAKPQPREALAKEGAVAAGSLVEVVKALGEKPRAVWVMLPAGRITEETVERLGGLLEPDDIIIDGGNSFYKDDIRRAKKLAEKRIRYVDCGTSGGVWGIERTLNMLDIAEVWRRGSVISSWLLDLGAAALAKDPQLKDFSGFVQDSGEGRWTVEAAIEEAVPADVLSTALYARFRSREEHTFGERMLSAMRFGFGGHIEGNEPIDPEPKPAESRGPSAATNAAE